MEKINIQNIPEKEQSLEVIQESQFFYRDIADFIFSQTIVNLQNKQISEQLLRNAQLAIASFYLDTTNEKKILAFFEKPKKTENVIYNELEYIKKTRSYNHQVDFVERLTFDYIGILVFSQLSPSEQDTISNEGDLNLLLYKADIAQNIIRNLINFNTSRTFFQSIFNLLQENIIQPYLETVSELDSISYRSCISEQITKVLNQIKTDDSNPRYFTEKVSDHYHGHIILSEEDHIHSFFQSQYPSQLILGTLETIPLISKLNTEIKILTKLEKEFISSHFNAQFIGNSNQRFIVTSQSYLKEPFYKYLLFSSPKYQNLLDEFESSELSTYSLLPFKKVTSPFLQRIAKAKRFLEVSTSYAEEIESYLEKKQIKKPSIKRKGINPSRKKDSINSSEVREAFFQKPKVILLNREYDYNIEESHELRSLIGYCHTYSKLALKSHELILPKKIETLLLIELCTYLTNLTIENFLEGKFYIQDFPIQNSDPLLLENTKHKANFIGQQTVPHQELSYSFCLNKIKENQTSINSYLNFELETDSTILQISFAGGKKSEEIIIDLIKTMGIQNSYRFLHSQELLENQENLLDKIYDSLLNLNSFHDLENYCKILSKLDHSSYNHLIRLNSSKIILVLENLISLFINADYSNYSGLTRTHTSHRFLYFLINKLLQFKKITTQESNKYKHQIEIKENQLIEQRYLKHKIRHFYLANEIQSNTPLNIEERKIHFIKKVDHATLKHISRKFALNEEEIEILLEIITKNDLYNEFLRDLITKENSHKTIEYLLNSTNPQAYDLATELIVDKLENLLNNPKKINFYILKTYALLKAERFDLIENNFLKEVAYLIESSSSEIKDKLEEIYQVYCKKIITRSKRSDSIVFRDYLIDLINDGSI